MPISLICGACEATLTAPDAAAGKRVKCRKCGAILEIPLPESEPDADYEVVEDAPTMMMPSVQSSVPRPAAKAPPPPVAKALPLPAKAKPKPVQLEIDDDDEDDRPSPKKKSKPALLDDDDEDDRPSPKKPVKKLVAVDDDDDDDRPRPKKLNKGKGKKKAAASNLPLLVGGGVLGLAVVGFLVWFLVLRTTEVAKGPITNPPGGGSQRPTPGGPGGPRFPGGAGGPQGPPAGWEEFKQPEFTVWIRSDNRPIRESEIPAAPGIQSGTAFARSTRDPNGGLLIRYLRLDAAKAAEAARDADVFIDTFLDRGAISGGGTIGPRHNTKLDGKTARDLSLQIGPQTFYLRVGVHNGTVVVLQAGGDGVGERHAMVTTFFDNFKFVEK